MAAIIARHSVHCIFYFRERFRRNVTINNSNAVIYHCFGELNDSCRSGVERYRAPRVAVEAVDNPRDSTAASYGRRRRSLKNAVY